MSSTSHDFFMLFYFVILNQIDQYFDSCCRRKVVQKSKSHISLGFRGWRVLALVLNEAPHGDYNLKGHFYGITCEGIDGWPRQLVYGNILFIATKKELFFINSKYWKNIVLEVNSFDTIHVYTSPWQCWLNGPPLQCTLRHAKVIKFLFLWYGW